MQLTFRPIDRWPGELRPDHERKSSPFKASYNDTLRLLDDELRHLEARNIVVQLALSEAELRLDGMLRASAKPAHPGVILAFDSKYGALKYATDVYEVRWGQREGWHANLRAIALSLEDLRAVDRRGVTRRGEQYTGWKALGAGIPMGAGSAPEFESIEEAAAFLVEHSEVNAEADDLIGEPGLVALAYRRAARRMHPDQGGDPDLFAKLGEARRMVETSRR